MNAALHKLGYPENAVWQGGHWCLLPRPAQMTFASLILGGKSEATAFLALPSAVFTELQTAIAAIEKTLTAFRPYARINYLMLMMVDPHVHFHLIPRYDAAQDYAGTSFTDAGRSGPPHLKSATAVPEGTPRMLLETPRTSWTGA